MAGTSLHHSTNPFTYAEHSGHSALSSDTGTCGGDDGIPVVDFDVLVNGAADQRAQAIRDLGRACEDWGFFMVINHGVPEELKEAMMETSKELFGLPEEEKAEHLEAGPMDPTRIGTGFFSSTHQFVALCLSALAPCPSLQQPCTCVCQGSCCGVRGEDERPAAAAGEGDL
ncbi:unnamed protein product [Urochloa humidicola]